MLPFKMGVLDVSDCAGDCRASPRVELVKIVLPAHLLPDKMLFKLLVRLLFPLEFALLSCCFIFCQPKSVKVQISSG